MATKTFKKYLKILNGLTPGKDHKYAKIYAYGLSKGNWFRATDVVTKKNKITDEKIKGALSVEYNSRGRVGEILKEMAANGFLEPEGPLEPRYYKATPDFIYTLIEYSALTEKECRWAKQRFDEIIKYEEWYQLVEQYDSGLRKLNVYDLLDNFIFSQDVGLFRLKGIDPKYEGPGLFCDRILGLFLEASDTNSIKRVLKETIVHEYFNHFGPDIKVALDGIIAYVKSCNEHAIKATYGNNWEKQFEKNMLAEYEGSQVTATELERTLKLADLGFKPY
ncbi:MAG: hypothetical protein L6243_01780 [Candidatus Altiarchaeales archaeon]|nr:hypothetical protein [Candidatus Altiarchaeota archaeon]MBU4341853.1 hypothetical protein [Candidatus Altiarchaeota archaeon]MCG2782299.1 hypothetical protein [Candidatus Altiarchaeales archaeon]